MLEFVLGMGLALLQRDGVHTAYWALFAGATAILNAIIAPS
jgi:hypothetical protein